MEGRQNITSKSDGIDKKRQTKSRNGCLRCKSKRLKCDETKPACHQCTSRKAQCPGYAAQPLIWSTRHEKTLLPESKFGGEINDLISNAQKAISGSENSTPAPQPTPQPEETIVSESVEPYVCPDTELSTHHNVSEPGPSRSMEWSPSVQPIGSKKSLETIRERLQRSTVPESMVHLPSELVYHYFSQVCSIFSSFDGSLNPFRTTIGKLFQRSAPVNYAIQGMAAAYLSNHFPRMALVGIQMQQEAYQNLSQNQLVQSTSIEDLDQILLTMLLIGPTTCWHNASDLGVRHLDMAKTLNRRRLQAQKPPKSAKLQRKNEFFDQSLVYWEMLASFVTDRDEIEEGTGLVGGSGSRTENPDLNTNQRIFPHPWAGVAVDVQRMFGKVGRLIRRFREETARTPPAEFFMPHNFDAMNFSSSTHRILEILTQAQALEEKLLSFGVPSVSSIVDAGDGKTPAHHFLLLAEVYRCAGLLEIYRVFPSILQQRLPLEGIAMAGGTYQRFFKRLHSSEQSNPSEWLVSFAIHILSLLQQIPITSGTRCLQPLAFITAAAELRFSVASISPVSMPASAQPVTTSVFSSISKREVEIAHMREFVTERIRDLKQYLPAKPIMTAQRLIQETWARSDMGHDVFWMDVMRDLRCESIFG